MSTHSRRESSRATVLARTLAILLWSAVGALLSAATFVAVLQWTLPPSDLAHGNSLRETFGDPFVRDSMLVGAGLCAGIAAVLGSFLLRGRRIWTSAVFATLSVLLTIAIGVPVLGAVALPLSLVALVAALLLCRLRPGRLFALRNPSQDVP